MKVGPHDSPPAPNNAGHGKLSDKHRLSAGVARAKDTKPATPAADPIEALKCEAGRIDLLDTVAA